MRIAPLDRSELAAAERVLADACAFDRASEVAGEKLFAPGPVPLAKPAPDNVYDPALLIPASAFGAWDGDALVGVAAVSGRWLRVLAVVPPARGKGAGSELLAACEAAAREGGESRLRTIDQPGNYLAPGIDERDTAAIRWLEKRGYQRSGDPRTNVLIDVRGNPRVTVERAEDLARTAGTKGYLVRRARADETELLHAVAKEFGGAWPFELERALGFGPPAVHVAVLVSARPSMPSIDAATTAGWSASATAETYCAFAAHDGNNRALGWFGPTGTWPAHRGKGLGEAVLQACLVDVGRDHDRCEVAWIGPRPFYEKSAGIVDERRFVVLARDL